MSRFLYIVIFLFLTGGSAVAQSQFKEAGIRGGVTSGFTYRQYLSDYLSYEGMLSFRNSGIQFTVVRQIHEIHADFNLHPGVHFLYGYGGHLGFFNSDTYSAFWRSELRYEDRRFTPVIGLDAFTSLEYRLNSYPVVVALDYKPFFEFSIYEFFRLRLTDIALSFRYRF